MARRRLTPIAVLDVPHAEHSAPRPPAPVPAPRSFDAPPIAHVAADAAATAAAEEIARTLATARETGRLVLDLPLEAIAADHLTRDRLPVEDEEMVALKSSLAAHGQPAAARAWVEATRAALDAPGRAGSSQVEEGKQPPADIVTLLVKLARTEHFEPLADLVEGRIAIAEGRLSAFVASFHAARAEGDIEPL